MLDLCLNNCAQINRVQPVADNLLRLSVNLTLLKFSSHN